MVDPPDAMPDAEIAASTATLTVTEGGAAGTFDVTLTNPPGGSVTVDVASDDTGAATVSPATLTFDDSNYDTAQTVTVTPVDDDDAGDESVTVTLSGTGFTDVTVAVTVTDDDMQAIVASTTTVTVTEGATGSTVGVSLAAQPSADVTVNVASADTGAATATPASLTFTSANWDSAQNVTVTGINDADTADESVDVTLSSTGLTDVVVAVTVTDDDVLNISATPGTLSLTEGGSTGSFAVVLTQQPAGAVTVNVATSDSGAASVSDATLSFDNTNWNTAQNVTVTPEDDDDAQDESVTITLSATGLTPQTVAVSVTDDETQGIIVTPIAAESIDEGTTINYSVRLAANPLASVSVGIATSDSGAGALSTTTLSFDGSDWSAGKTVTVTGVEDNDLADESVLLTFSSSGLTDVTRMLSVNDDDTQDLVVSTNDLGVTEGETSSFTVNLAYQPGGSVTVDLTSNNTDVATVSPTQLTFNDTNWFMPQTVMVSGVEDANLVPDSTTIDVDSTGIGTEIVNVDVTDNDAQRIVVSPSTVALTEGGSATTLNVRLAFDPGGPVTVNYASTDSDAAAVSGGGTLSFDSGNYSTNQQLTVSPVTDLDTRDEVLDIDFTATGIPDTTVPVTVDDDDTQGIILSTNSLVISEQGTPGTFEVSLAFDPVDPVAVTVGSSDNGAASASPTTINFNTDNYDSPVTVSVAGVSDPDLVDENVTITVSSAIAASETVSVTVQEDDLQQLVVTAPDPFNVTEGSSTSFTVNLAFQPPGTVGATANDVNNTVSAAPGNLLFTTTNYGDPQTVDVTGLSDPNLWDTTDTIEVRSPGLTGTDIPVTVFDDDEQDIIITNVTTGQQTNSLNFLEGETRDITVRLAFIPYCEQASPGCDETVTLTSPDVDAVTLDMTDAVALNFSATTYTVPQTVVVAGVDDADVLAENVSVTVDSSQDAAQATNDEILTVTINDDDTQNFVFEADNTSSLLEEDEPGQLCVSLLQDPVTPLVVTATSQDPTTVAVNGGTSDSVTFTTSDYQTPQCFDVAAIDDIDLQDETIAVRFSSAGIADDSDQLIDVTDNDEQVILVHQVPTGGTFQRRVDVDEGAQATFYLSLAYQPTSPITVYINELTGGDKYDFNVSSVDFDGTNFQTRVPVVVSGLQDSPEDLDDHISLRARLTTAPDVPVSSDEGAEELAIVSVFDTDAQEIVITLRPEEFPISIQEGGPTDNFFVALRYPPRAAEGPDEVVVLSPDAAELRVNDTDDEETPAGQVTLTFDAGNFDQMQEVVVTALEDWEAGNTNQDPSLEQDDDFDIGVNIPGEVNPPNGGTFQPTSVAVHVNDDETAIIHDVTITEMDGATRYTKRQNVNWTDTTVVVTAYDASSGETVVASSARDQLDTLVPTVTVADSTGVSGDPTEAVEFDGTNVGVFSTDATGIVYASYDVGLNSEIVGPTTVSGTNSTDFWPSWNGSTYGLIYRDRTDGNLLFRSVTPGGVASAPVIATTQTASSHLRPNLHPRTGGWVVVYTTATAVRCLRLNSNGTPVAFSDVVLPGLPPGAFVSSVRNVFQGTIMLAYADPTEGLSVAEINTSCSVLSNGPANVGGGQLLNPPFIAFNGYEFKIAYDLTDGTMGVTTLDATGNYVDDINVGTGSRPSIAWAGDRWVLRAQGSLLMQSGSFQTHCNDGAENVNETGVDCGGPDCQPCPPPPPM